MAITKISYCKMSKNGFHDHLNKLIEYIKNPGKTEECKYVNSFNCTTTNTLREMVATQKSYDKEFGRDGYQIIISFSEEENVTPETAFEIINEFAEKYLAENHEIITACHVDKKHVHGHIVFNSVRFTDGLKFRYNNGDWEKYMQPLVDKLCLEHGLEPLKYKKFNKDKLTNYKEYIREIVDAAIEQSNSFESFLEALTAAGFRIKYGKHLAVKCDGMERYRRLYSLGVGYSEAAIKERIAMKFRGVDKTRLKAPGKSIVSISFGERNYKRYKQMTYYEKIHFRRMLSLHVIKRRTPSWIQSEEQKELKKEMIELDVIRKYGISNLASLIAAKARLEEEIFKHPVTDPMFEENIKPYVPAINDYKKMIKAETKALLFLNGDKNYEKEYLLYLDLKNKFESHGISDSEVKQLKSMNDDYYKLKRKNSYQKKLELSAVNRLIKKEIIRSKMKKDLTLRL